MIDASRYGPWALIAGGSEGVGAAFAQQLGAAGINLVLVARSPGPLEEAAAAARALGVEVRTVSVDLLKADSVDQVRRTTDGLDVGLLVFNAGANTYGGDVVGGDLARQSRDRLASGADDRAPASYQQQVDNYFKALATGR